MKKFTSLLTLALFCFAMVFMLNSTQAYAQAKGKSADKGYVDANSDGVNDNAADDDGDSIPNGKDPDYTGTTRFVDEDGDGLNDKAKDDDGDGIPNGQDPDYVKPADGSGMKNGQQNKNSKGQKLARQYKGAKGGTANRNTAKGFIDENGDGINDNADDSDGDGIPNGRDADYQRNNPLKGKGKLGFIDEDGDGINDNAMDADGDGIPNGQDPDYQKLMDGSGRAMANGKGYQGRRNGSGSCAADDNTAAAGAKGKTGSNGNK
jgi:hypothetical protein